MSLTFTLRERIPLGIEVDSICWNTLRHRSLAETRRLTVHVGNSRPTLGDLFDVDGSPEDGEILIAGECECVHGIGAGLTSGRIDIDGNAGRHLGAGMSGGKIRVRGNASDRVGTEMRGGEIVISGNAGNLVGAVQRGGRRGMTGGEIVIGGNAGHEVGHSLRRGLIAIGGNVGDALGERMIAGSLFVGGTAGRAPGAGMRRGTVVILGETAQPRLLPTFRYGGEIAPLALTLFERHLRGRGLPLPLSQRPQPLHVYRGDSVERGLGEILTALPAAE